MRFHRALVAGALAVVVAGGGLAVTAAPAQAVTQHTYCGDGDACLYYRINYGGSMVGIPDQLVPDYLASPAVLFRTTGDGKGAVVGNQTGSYYNNNGACALRVYEHKNYGGRYNTFGQYSGSGNNEFVTRNNNRGHIFCP
ncbi:peptidase inhibitor family I36 protein [Micromonospora sp. NPDC050397]|uniref:peptidase inhibitor family I36 protein n=1 Tax=Micromonospora sp. NPDC050397 TaxID=3364279 RepID=UPI003850EA87